MKSVLLGLVLVASSASAQTTSCVGECVNLPNRNNVTVNVAGSGVQTPILDGAFYKAFARVLDLQSADRLYEYYLYNNVLEYPVSTTNWDGTVINSTLDCTYPTESSSFGCRFTGTSSIVYPEFLAFRYPYFHLQGNKDSSALANIFTNVLEDLAKDAKSFPTVVKVEENGIIKFFLKSLSNVYWADTQKMNENVMICTYNADPTKTFCEVELLESQIPQFVSTTL